jgi:hypothetical protein
VHRDGAPEPELALRDLFAHTSRGTGAPKVELATTVLQKWLANHVPPSGEQCVRVLDMFGLKLGRSGLRCHVGPA